MASSSAFDRIGAQQGHGGCGFRSRRGKTWTQHVVVAKGAKAVWVWGPTRCRVTAKGSDLETGEEREQVAIDVGKSTVGKSTVDKSTAERYMVRRRQRPSPTWRALLRNHAKDLVAISSFVVPTVRFQVLFVLIALAHDRRRIVHFNVSEKPTAEWTARQVVEAFPWGHAPRCLLRDRDGVYGQRSAEHVRGMGLEEAIIARQRAWQNGGCS